VAAFRSDERLRQNLARSLEVMLHFYGLAYDRQSGKVVRRGDFEERARNWIDPYNHNYRRITRILNCLVALGLEDRARAFFACLREIYAMRERDIGPETFEFWREAARAPAEPPAPAGPPPLRLEVLAGTFAVCRLDPGAPLPAAAWQGECVSITR